MQMNEMPSIGTTLTYGSGMAFAASARLLRAILHDSDVVDGERMRKPLRHARNRGKK